MFKQNLNTYWETVVETIQDGIMIVDKKGTIVSVNSALEKIVGYDNSELVGSPCTILNCDLCEIARDTTTDHWCRLFRTGSVNMRKCVVQRKDGSFVHVIKNAALLKDNDGKVIGAVETITDITELVVKDFQIEAYKRELRAEDGFHGILGASAQMRKVFDLIENAAQSDAPVLILGESGSGKELVARAIHEIGPRKDKPYVKVNCAALNESLLESELFGHVKGAFTGAYRSRQGRFEAASGGDIFLDEIGDLPLSTQVKLLRVLEEKVIERVGDNRPIPVDVRIITATNRDLQDLVSKGAFRQDLFFRINVIPIHLPPLRERREDIPILAEAFFNHIRLKTGREITGITKEAMLLLINYPWPGNVRELKSAFEYAFVACQENLIQPYHFPPHIYNGEIPKRKSDKMFSLNKDKLKKQELIKALKQAKGNQSEAARILGVSRVTIWNRMKRYGINLSKNVGA
ncbi:MAG: sigma-54-dependent Fis family transcriptional regulator [Deltaproteobacteria bacterium]|nr:MAG: sigma-54-dependent Fis family transcriptional regulator [Deltaproteobacteria bacterium]